ncbi:hypothetical protein FNV43_RR26939 [Rhamnella rubrinervis]|uniref:Uncharacterized protein n=1 Tax=Rhamnella rubrinervis TaxID=2594499 RepID=A0A8K0DJP2_9ROSA|nr:hypothetical protein FNV43_RR26939 [Rhamnella rubrinervis]
MSKQHNESSCEITSLVASEEGQKCQAVKTFCVPRRDAIICLTAETLIGLTVFATEPANARVVKPETRKKIFERLEKLREEAGVSKPKTNNGNSSSPSPPSGKDEKLQASPPSQNPFENPVVVESILP